MLFGGFKPKIMPDTRNLALLGVDSRQGPVPFLGRDPRTEVSIGSSGEQDCIAAPTILMPVSGRDCRCVEVGTYAVSTAE